MSQLLTVPQVAERLACSTSHVRMLMRATELYWQFVQGRRPADSIPRRYQPLLDCGFPRPIRLSKGGRLVRIAEDELRDWLAQSRRG